MDFGAKQPNLSGDVVKRAEDSEHSSSEAELAKFKLLEARLRVSGRDAEVKSVLGQFSEVDEIAIQILKEINQYRESSPEACQLRLVTGSASKFKQANWLAEHIVSQSQAKAIIQRYTPEDDISRAMMYDAEKRSLELRTKKLSANAKGADASQSVAQRLTRAVSSSASALLSGGGAPLRQARTDA